MDTLRDDLGANRRKSGKKTIPMNPRIGKGKIERRRFEDRTNKNQESKQNLFKKKKNKKTKREFSTFLLLFYLIKISVYVN